MVSIRRGADLGRGHCVMGLHPVFKVLICCALSLALSGCFGFGRQSWRGEYGQGDGGGMTVDTSLYNVASAPKACVNDLEIYRAHLQAPEDVSKDLGRPLRSYVNEAGSARSALNNVHAELNDLQGALNNELAQRNAFDVSNRARSDTSIAVLEDEIFLNEALAEALECRI